MGERNKQKKERNGGQEEKEDNWEGRKIEKIRGRLRGGRRKENKENEDNKKKWEENEREESDGEILMNL